MNFYLTGVTIPFIKIFLIKAPQDTFPPLFKSEPPFKEYQMDPGW